MKRSRRLLLVAHCVLNQNSVVHPLARTPGGFTSAVELALRAGVGIIQLPCPELAFGGCSRAPATRQEYDTPSFCSLCIQLSKEVEATLKPMIDDGCRVVGVLGIAGSPSCSVVEPTGVWMEQLLSLPLLAGVRVLAIPENYPWPDKGEEFEGQLRELLSTGKVEGPE